MSDRFKVSKLLADRLRERQVSVVSVLRHAALPAHFLKQEKIYASTSKLFALWKAIGEVGRRSSNRLETRVRTAIRAL